MADGKIIKPYGLHQVLLYYPVAATTKIERGKMVALNSTGYAVEATDSATDIGVVGIANETIDNSSGADGDVYINVMAGDFVVPFYDTFAVTDAASVAYVYDDEKVARAAGTSNECKVGTILAPYYASSTGNVTTLDTSCAIVRIGVHVAGLVAPVIEEGGE